MKVRFSLYERKGQEECLKVLKETWGDEWIENRQAIQEGAVKALLPLESQLKVVLQRENIEAEIGFDVWMEEQKQSEDTVCIQTYLMPKKVGTLSLENLELWFRLGKAFVVLFEVLDEFYHPKDATIPEEIIKEATYRELRLVSSDIAREGIPQEMKRDIGEIKRGLSHLEPFICFEEPFIDFD